MKKYTYLGLIMIIIGFNYFTNYQIYALNNTTNSNSDKIIYSYTGIYAYYYNTVDKIEYIDQNKAKIGKTINQILQEIDKGNKTINQLMQIHDITKVLYRKIKNSALSSDLQKQYLTIIVFTQNQIITKIKSIREKMIEEERKKEAALHQSAVRTPIDVKEKNSTPDSKNKNTNNIQSPKPEIKKKEIRKTTDFSKKKQGNYYILKIPAKITLLVYILEEIKNYENSEGIKLESWDNQNQQFINGTSGNNNVYQITNNTNKSKYLKLEVSNNIKNINLEQNWNIVSKADYDKIVKNNNYQISTVKFRREGDDNNFIGNFSQGDIMWIKIK